MRGGRSLLVLFVAFGGLLAYLYFVDAKKPVVEEGVEKHDKVFDLEADKIDELTKLCSIYLDKRLARER